MVDDIRVLLENESFWPASEIDSNILNVSASR